MVCTVYQFESPNCHRLPAGKRLFARRILEFTESEFTVPERRRDFQALQGENPTNFIHACNMLTK